MSDLAVVDKAKLSNDQRVRQANALAKSGQELDLLEKRLLLLAMARIKSTDNELLTHRIHLSELSEIFGSNPYQRAQKAARGLMRRMVYVTDADGGFTEFQWTTLARYVPAKKSESGESYIEIRLNEELSPLLLQLREKFNSIPLLELLPMQSFNAQRLYEVLWHDSHGGKKQFLTYDIAELKWHLGLRFKTIKKGRTVWEEKYKSWRDFKKVLQRAQAEFEQHGRIRFRFTGATQGRATSHVRFNLTFVDLNMELSADDSGNAKDLRSEQEIKVALRLETIGYAQDPFKLIDEHGVAVVAHAIKLGEQAKRSTMTTSNPIRNLPGFIYDLIVKGVAKRQLELSKEANTQEIQVDPREIVSSVRAAFDAYREEVIEEIWQRLDEDTRTNIPAMMRIEFAGRRTFTLEALDRVGWSGPQYRSARNTYLFEQYADELPEDAVDIKVFVESRDLLVGQPDNIRAQVLSDSLGGF